MLKRCHSQCPAPSPNGQKRPFIPITNTPVPSTQEVNYTQQATPEMPWSVPINNAPSPQRLQLGQKGNSYNLHQQMAPQTRMEQTTNEVPQPFQFSPIGSVDAQQYDLNSITAPIQMVQTNDATTPVQAMQTNNVAGGPFGAAPTAFNNEKNGPPAKKPDATASGQNAQKGPITKQLGTTALAPNNSQQTRVTRQLGPVTGMLTTSGTTTNLQNPVGEYSGDTGMLKLHQPVKVVKVPIAGQPGQYMTGILQVAPRPQTRTGALPPPAPTQIDPTLQGKAKQYSKIIILVAAILVVIFSSSIYVLTRPAPISHSDATTQSVGTISANNPNATATAAINATATVEETNLILDDPLSENINNWRQGNYAGGQHYEFKNGAYHIRSNDRFTTLAALTSLTLPAKYSYSLTMQPIAGNQDSPFNFYGLMLRYSEDKNGIPTFYFFSIINNKDQTKYQFRRYDGHKPKDQNPWVATPFQHNVGNELHKGDQPNTVKIIVDGSHFTFIVNGKQVGDAQDSTYKETQAVGMGVNEKGSEVAFTNFRLVRLQ